MPDAVFRLFGRVGSIMMEGHWQSEGLEIIKSRRRLSYGRQPPMVCLGLLGLGLIFASGANAVAQAPAEVYPGPTPRAECGPGSNPEVGRQGRVSAEDAASGRAAQGYTCNTEQLSRFGTRGGYKVERFTDRTGRECAYYDTTLLFPKDAVTAGQDLTGVYVLDMTNPRKPVRTETLVTPAMQSPHESVALNTKRGLLIAVTSNLEAYPGFVDVYDLNQDCRHPALRASLPFVGLGHESGFAPDGKTFYAASLDLGTVTAVDLSNPSLPVTLWIRNFSRPHGMSVSDDGNRVYLADRPGLVILDVSQIQARTLNPQHRVVSGLTWPTLSTPQITIPVTISDRPFLIEMDEFGSGAKVGAARIIDIADETKPFVVSNIKLEVNMPENQTSQVNDPGVGDAVGFQGYTGHYCSVPDRKEPGVVACTFIMSGLRLFDIRDPYRPREIAYFNAPPGPAASPADRDLSNFAMSSIAFVPERSEIWYTDGNSGFYAVRVTNGVWPFGSLVPAGTNAGQGQELAATGATNPALAIGLAVLVAGLALAAAVGWARPKREQPTEI